MRAERRERNESRANRPVLVEVVCVARHVSSRSTYAPRQLLKAIEERSLCTSPSHKPSCCSFRKFITRFVLPDRT